MDANDVAHYLKDNPSFFEEFADVIAHELAVGGAKYLEPFPGSLPPACPTYHNWCILSTATSAAPWQVVAAIGQRRMESRCG